MLAYAASYFARGYLAGHRMFGLYGALVFFEACARVMFALLAVLGRRVGRVVRGDGHGGGADRLARRGAVGADPARAVADGRPRPRRRRRRRGRLGGEAGEFTLAHGAGFAVAVLLIMVAEQTFLNAGPLLLKATADSDGAALAGFAFNVLLIARAPLQLFQAIQTSILPHLTKSQATGEADAVPRARST